MLQKTQSFYNIQFVSKVTGINPHTIRAWEKRYEAVTPLRDDKGRRIYSQAEIDRLELLNKLVSCGNNISDIANLSTDELNAMYETFADRIESSTPSGKKEIIDFDIDQSLNNLKLGLLGYKIDILGHELNKAVLALKPRDLAMKVVIPFLTEVRNLEKSKLINDEQKEVLMTVVKVYLTKALNHNERTQNNDSPIILAAPSGSLNEIGAMMTCLLCQHYNLNFHFLGGHLSSHTVGQIAKQLNAKLVILGATFSLYQMSPSNFNNYIDGLIEEVSEKTSVWLNGLCSPEVKFNQSQVETLCNFDTLDQKLANFSTWI
jgi:DNA-binding transcriptional MerR regulator